jgi:RNA polymerase-binding transcription factor DksA
MKKVAPKQSPAKAAPKPAAKAKAPAPKAAAPKAPPAKPVAAAASVKGKTPAAFKPVAKPAEPAPATKALVLGARKRKSTPAIFKIRSRKNTPIVFTLDDVREIIKNRRQEKPKSGAEDVPLKGVPLPEKPILPPGKAKAPAPVIAAKPRKNRTLGAASLADILGVASPPKTTKAISITQMMDDERIPQKWRKYYRQLVEMREEIRQGLDLHTSETLKRSSKEDSGDLSGYSQHMADAGTTTFDRDFALSLVSSEQELLYEIEEALKRMRNNAYGICEITAKPISAERLAAVPFTRYSLEGQKELEKTRRFGTQRGTAVGVFGEATTEDAAALAEDDAEA